MNGHALILHGKKLRNNLKPDYSHNNTDYTHKKPPDTVYIGLVIIIRNKNLVGIPNHILLSGGNMVNCIGSHVFVKFKIQGLDKSKQII